jgi:hypothetical protein
MSLPSRGLEVFLIREGISQSLSFQRFHLIEKSHPPETNPPTYESILRIRP